MTFVDALQSGTMFAPDVSGRSLASLMSKELYTCLHSMVSRFEQSTMVHVRRRSFDPATESSLTLHI